MIHCLFVCLFVYLFVVPLQPTVREMGALSSENRQLKDRVQQLEVEKTSLSDEVLAYKTYVRTNDMHEQFPTCMSSFII